MKRNSFIIGFFIFLVINAFAQLQMPEDANMKELFEKKYDVWKHFMQTPDSAFLSDTTGITTEQFKEIIALGVPALPYIVEKMKEDSILFVAVQKITKKKFHTTYTGKPGEQYFTVEEYPDVNNVKAIHWDEIWLRWWEEDGGRTTPEKFEKFYQHWQELKTQGKETEAKEKYQRMVDLGIFALPSMMEKIQQGDTKLIPAVSELTDNKVSKDAEKSECINWWNENKQNWPKPPEPALKRKVNDPNG